MHLCQAIKHVDKCNFLVLTVSWRREKISFEKLLGTKMCVMYDVPYKQPDFRSNKQNYILHLL